VHSRHVWLRCPCLIHFPTGDRPRLSAPATSPCCPRQFLRNLSAVAKHRVTTFSLSPASTGGEERSPRHDRSPSCTTELLNFLKRWRRLLDVWPFPFGAATPLMCKVTPVVIGRGSRRTGEAQHTSTWNWRPRQVLCSRSSTPAAAGRGSTFGWSRVPGLSLSTVDLH